VQVSVEAEATNIPTGIEVSIAGMEVGASVHAGDLELPRGVTLDEDPDVMVLHVIAAPTAEQIEAEIGAEVAAEAVPAAGEAAPAEPAAAEAEAAAAESGESA